MFFGFDSGKCDLSWLRDWKFPSRIGNKDQSCTKSVHFLEYIHVYVQVEKLPELDQNIAAHLLFALCFVAGMCFVPCRTK